MKKHLVVVVTVVLLLTLTVFGAPKKPKLPAITGGGVVQNFNSISPYGTVELLTMGGFNAQATADGVEVVYQPFNVIAKVYQAKGEVQANFSPVDDPSGGNTVHGKVVCIANLGPSKFVDGDDRNDDFAVDPDGDVWEIRFRITHIDGSPPPTPFPIHGSLFIQDNGKLDSSDESFATALLPNPACAQAFRFGLEPVLGGNIMVH